MAHPPRTDKEGAFELGQALSRCCDVMSLQMPPPKDAEAELGHTYSVTLIVNVFNLPTSFLLYVSHAGECCRSICKHLGLNVHRKTKVSAAFN